MIYYISIGSKKWSDHFVDISDGKIWKEKQKLIWLAAIALKTEYELLPNPQATKPQKLSSESLGS